MKFLLTRVSGREIDLENIKKVENVYTIEINSLEELMKLLKRIEEKYPTRHENIISAGDEEYDGRIRIYDDYIE